MACLDRTRPYGHTVGPDYQYLVQDGRQFTMAGLPMDGDLGAEPAAVSTQNAAAVVARVQSKSGKADTLKPDEHELADLSNDELKVLVDVNGGKWSGRDAAIKFLNGA